MSTNLLLLSTPFSVSPFRLQFLLPRWARPLFSSSFLSFLFLFFPFFVFPSRFFRLLRLSLKLFKLLESAFFFRLRHRLPCFLSPNFGYFWLRRPTSDRSKTLLSAFCGSPSSLYLLLVFLLDTIWSPHLHLLLFQYRPRRRPSRSRSTQQHPRFTKRSLLIFAIIKISSLLKPTSPLTSSGPTSSNSSCRQRTGLPRRHPPIVTKRCLLLSPFPRETAFGSPAGMTARSNWNASSPQHMVLSLTTRSSSSPLETSSATSLQTRSTSAWNESPRNSLPATSANACIPFSVSPRIRCCENGLPVSDSPHFLSAEGSCREVCDCLGRRGRGELVRRPSGCGRPDALSPSGFPEHSSPPRYTQPSVAPGPRT